MRKGLLLIVGLILLAGAATAAFVRMSDDNEPEETNTQTQTNSNETQSSEEATESMQAEETSDDAVAAATITYSDDGFSPTSVKIKAGETVKIKNTSSRAVEFSSDPHPVHTDNRELNLGPIQAGESVNLKVMNKGTWGYHNHLDENESGTIVVE
jgi:plastocyanin